MNQHQPTNTQAIAINEIIGMYIGIASIETEPSEERNRIIDTLEKVISTFVLSLSNGSTH